MTTGPTTSPDWPAIRRRFHCPDGVSYLDGNSLGLASDAAQAALERALQQWKDLGIAGWMDADPPWLDLSREVTRRCAPIVGAKADQIVACGSTTSNLHQLLATLFEPDDERNAIVVDSVAFPTDRYVVDSHLRLRGLDPVTHAVVVPSRDGLTLDTRDVLDALARPGVAIAVLPAVVYTSGQLLDLKTIQAEAERLGVAMIWDCSHAAGSVPLDLDEIDADAAVWCGYKYLNGGPGCVAFAYLNRRHFGLRPGLAGWFASSDDALFAMPPKLHPAPDARRLQMGTPHVLSLAPLLKSLELVADAGIDAIRQRSLELTSLLMNLIDARLPDFAIVTPRGPSERGGHVTVRHPDARRLVPALASAGIVTDFREPDLIRIAPVALYNTEADVERVTTALGRLGTTVACP